MEKKEFLEELADLMDTETELAMETELSGIEEWDSLSHVAFLALCTRTGAKDVKPKAVHEAKTVQDLYALINKA